MQTKKRIVAMILTVVMIFTAVNFLPQSVIRADAESGDDTATDTDAVQVIQEDEIPVVQLVAGGDGAVKVSSLNTASYGGTDFSSFTLSNGCIGFCTNHEARRNTYVAWGAEL